MSGKQETEIVFYARIGHAEGLNEANEIEEHDQLEARLLDGNKIRVRKTTKGGQVTYIFTAKKKEIPTKEGDPPPLMQESMEFNTPVTEEFFNNFLEIMEQRITKKRYHYTNRPVSLNLEGITTPVQVEGAGFEVDVFIKDGKVSEWVKIDVEVDTVMEYLKTQYPDIDVYKANIRPTDLPFKPLDVIYPPMADEQKREFIKNLWATEFTTRREVVSEPKSGE